MSRQQHVPVALLRRGRFERIPSRLAGVMLGVAFTPADLLAVLVGLLSRDAVRSMIRLERWRVAVLLKGHLRSEPREWRAVGYLAARSLLGILAGTILALIVAGVVVAVSLTVGAVTGGPVPLFDASAGQVTYRTVAVFVLPGLILLFLAVQGLVGVAQLEAKLWNAFARPGNEELEDRVSQLTVTLADVVNAIDDERRRIERDIHDGVQQRVVALSILLGRAERQTEPQERSALHRRALEETRHILDDLRDVSWRVYPAMLARDGLGPALEALRERTHVPIHLDYRLTVRCSRSVESAAYFVASEAVTNVVKHAAAHSIGITVQQEAGRLTMTVRDDGVGGADPAGQGIAGITSRVTALAGTFDLDSPVGGPTVIRVEIPCA
ncbi:sensor histidine kinase [Microbacterium lushaniae]|nr:sensor histidine kinase [Microbacterium lushaniae]KAA9156064.1 sensor histidine kinase [Microbacterium lushaniae]